MFTETLKFHQLNCSLRLQCLNISINITHLLCQFVFSHEGSAESSMNIEHEQEGREIKFGSRNVCGKGSKWSRFQCKHVCYCLL